jgi:hypothetical protein
MTTIRCAVLRAIVLVSLVASLSRAQDTAHFVPAGRVSVRHLTVMPWDTVPGIRGKTIVGTVGSLSLIELSPGAASAAPDHYHTREQINVGLAGGTRSPGRFSAHHTRAWYKHRGPVKRGACREEH